MTQRAGGLTNEGRKKIEATFRADLDLENSVVSGFTHSEHNEVVRMMRKLSLMIRE